MKNMINRLLVTVGLLVGFTHSAWAAAHVDAIVVGTQTGSVTAGVSNSVTYSISATGNGAGGVTWSITNNLPAGVTASFSASGGGSPWTTTLTLSCQTNAAFGTNTFYVKTSAGTVTGTGTLVVSKHLVTAVVAVDNKVYDGTTSATITNLSLTGVIGGDSVSLTGGTATFATKTVGASKTVTITGLSLTGANAASYALSSTTVTSTASITQRPLLVGATGVSRVYNGGTNATVNLTDNRVISNILTITYSSASFSDKNVATGKVVSVTGINVAGTDAANYSFNTTTSTTADITAASLAVTATGVNKTYDTTLAATVTLSDNRVPGDDLATTYGGATFATKTVGTGKSVTVTGINVTGGDAGNYTFNTGTNTTASITAASLTVTATGVNKGYDSTTAATVTLADNHLTNDIVSETYTNAVFADKNVGTGKTVSVSGISLSGEDAANYTFNTTASTVADITIATLTVTATGSNKVYDATTAATVSLMDNHIDGDSLSLSYTNATFADKAVGTNKTISVAGINVTGLDSSNYTFNATASASATISPASLIVTATGTNKVYDGTSTATVTLADNRISGDVLTLAYTNAAFADKIVATNKSITVTGITVTGTDSGNYTFNNGASTSADITAASLVVTATGVNKPYDTTTSATVTLSDNRIGGDDLTTVYTNAVFSDKNVGVGKTVTVTGVSVTGLDVGNYTFNTDTTTTADITAAGLTVTATGVTKVYDGTPAATVTLADNHLAGDSVVLAYTNATFADKIVATNKLISVTGITVTGTDSSNYTFNASASAAADITAASLTVSATGINKAYNGNAAATVTLGDNRVAGDILTLAYTNAAFSDKVVGTNKTVSVAGITVTGTDAVNYTFNTSTATTASITKAALAVSATGVNKVYDGTNTATVTLADNRVSGDLLTVTYVGATFANKDVGTGKLVSVTGINVTGTDSGNYSFNTSTNTTANITGAVLTVTANDQTRQFGAPNPAFTVQYSGFISGEGLEVLSGAPSLATTATAGSSVVGGPYLITVTNGTLAAADYSFNFVNGHLAITPAHSTNVVTLSANPVLTGGSVTFFDSLSAVLPSSGSPTGAVQFLVDGTPFGSPATISSNVAQLSTSALSHGYHVIGAVYNGSGDFFGSTNSLTTQLLINSPPVASADTLVTFSNTATNVAVATLKANDSDPDGDSFNLTLTGGASTQGGVVGLLAGTVTYAPPVNFTGADSFNYTLTDTFGASANGTVNVNVLGTTNNILSVKLLSDKNVEITVQGTVGLTYVVQGATNVASPTWVPLHTNVAGVNGQFVYDDLTATNGRAKFYRIAN